LIAQTVIGPEDQDKVIAELVSFIRTTICDIEQDGLIH
jgi:hypothetical protein